MANLKLYISLSVTFINDNINPSLSIAIQWVHVNDTSGPVVVRVNFISSEVIKSGIACT